MTNGSGVSRGDRTSNARLGRLRSAVPVSNAIVGIDLADRKQVGDGSLRCRGQCPRGDGVKSRGVV